MLNGKGRHTMLTLREMERLAYIQGDVTAAQLLAEREDLENEIIRDLEDEVKDLERQLLTTGYD